MPDTLDETYERTLREIRNADWELAHRLFQCVAVASRPFRVKELAEFLAFDFQAGSIPQFREDWRLEDPMEAVLSTCSTLLSLVHVDGSAVIQFSHFSVQEFLVSTRFAEKRDAISQRYHVSLTAAHALVTQACLGILFHLDKDITRDGLANYPLATYAAMHWIKHARFEGVSQCVEEGTKRLFDGSKPHLAIWAWITEPYPEHVTNELVGLADKPLSLRGTPLHYAATCGFHTVVISLAVEHPQYVHSPCGDEEATPLHLASGEGHLAVARVLIEQGANVTAQSKSGLTPLHYAAHNGHVEVARFLIKHGAIVTAQTKGGVTPLYEGLLGSRCLFTSFLVGHRAGATAQVKDMSTWYSASSHDRMELVRLLVEHGADVTARSGYVGWTPLHLASYIGHDVQLARFLVEHGADVTAQDNDGSTPLFKASLNDNVDLMRFLVEHGAEVIAQNKYGSTPLHEASESTRSNLELVQFLVDHGADVVARSKKGRTPLHQAAQSHRDNTDLARFLVEHGADVTVRDKDGSTPLHQALSRGHVDLTRFLVEHGADVTAQDKDGSTPLHMASLCGHVNLVEFLIEHGADVTTLNRDGSTPLHELARHGVSRSRLGYVNIAQLHIKHGANVAVQDKDGSTPLDLALSGGHEPLAQFLLDHSVDITSTGCDAIPAP